MLGQAGRQVLPGGQVNGVIRGVTYDLTVSPPACDWDALRPFAAPGTVCYSKRCKGVYNARAYPIFNPSGPIRPLLAFVYPKYLRLPVGQVDSSVTPLTLLTMDIRGTLPPPPPGVTAAVAKAQKPAPKTGRPRVVRHKGKGQPATAVNFV
ncbi:hypothetical protein ABPG75_010871 [Micractinium tetrahymenae]